MKILSVLVILSFILFLSPGCQAKLSAGSINDDGITINTKDISTLGFSKKGYSKSLENQNYIVMTGKWNATQYEKGDIIKNEYTIQKGDTLWQIAKGFYGNPLKWKEILQRNNSTIKYLPNKQKALIIPGQVIILP